MGVQKGTLPKEEREFLSAAAAGLALQGPGGNLMSMVLTSWGPAELSAFPRPAFGHLLACFGSWMGPAQDFMVNVLRARLSADLNLPRLLGGDRDRARAGDRARARLSGEPDPWGDVLGDPAAHGPMLDVICDLLNLVPRSHWWEMLRLRLLPQIPSRITIANPTLWQSVELAFQSGNVTEADVQHAATFLLLDIWLWVTECYKEPQASRFHQLAELTRASAAPELRITHCLRDIAHGNEAREADLQAMLQSKDPATRRMFIDSFWLDDDDSPRRSKKQ